MLPICISGNFIVSYLGVFSILFTIFSSFSLVIFAEFSLILGVFDPSLGEVADCSSSLIFSEAFRYFFQILQSLLSCQVRKIQLDLLRLSARFRQAWSEAF